MFFFKILKIDFTVQSYEEYVKDISVTLYFKTVAEIYSMLSFTMFLAYLRYSYNRSLYPTFIDSNLKFQALLLKYLFLFVFEIVAIQGMKMFMEKKMKIDFRHIVREATLNQYQHRFLFACWLCHVIHDVYFSLCVIYFN